MSRNLDRDVILSYVDEAMGYLPIIRKNLDLFFKNTGELELLDEAYRHIHTIKGASSMVGFKHLSHMAYLVEDTLEEIGAEQMELNQEVMDTIAFSLEKIEIYLQGIADDKPDDQALLRSVTTRFRRLRGLPQEDDEKALRALLSDEPKKVEETPWELPEASAHISNDLKKIFELEAEEHLEALAKNLIDLSQDHKNRAALDEIRRHMHTLKGSAGLVGFDNITQLAHRSEDLLDLIFHANALITQPHLDLLQNTLDLLGDMLHQEPGFARRSERLNSIYQQYQEATEAFGDQPVEEIAPEDPPELEDFEMPEQEPLAVPKKPDDGAVAVPQTAHEYLRVPQKRLDDLVQTVSDLMIHRTTFEQALAGMTTQAEELRPSIRRLQRIATSIEREYEVALLDAGRMIRGVRGSVEGNTALSDFDALEMDRYTEFHLLARDLAETTHDLYALSRNIQDVLGDFEGYMHRSSRLTSEAQDQLLKMRMVPLSNLVVRLQRAVRVTANKSGKKVQLSITGERIELDKTVMEELVDPLVHILRNSIDHGIESPELRLALGKNPIGQIHLNAFHSGTQVVLEISDDGAGMAVEKLRKKAINSGYLSPEQAKSMSQEDIYELVFRPGFSTAGKVSEVSGRGVGLDIVRAVVQKLKGSIRLQNTAQAGLKVVIKLPLTLAILKVILVKTHKKTFAVPLNHIIQITQPDPSELVVKGDKCFIRSGESFVPILNLGTCLGLPKHEDQQKSTSPLLLVQLGTHTVGLQVDQLLEAREVVVKNLGRHLQNLPGITGATLMGDGSVVLILNPIDLATQELRPHKEHIQETTPEKTQILVVDDSVSVRKVLTQLLHSAGFEAITAKDGVEALEKLQQMPQLPEAIVLDIEMPRMDGYELTSIVRGHPRFQNLPILMLTSRGANRHKEKARDLGVTEYLVKPFRAEVLLNLLHRHIGTNL